MQGLLVTEHSMSVLQHCNTKSVVSQSRVCVLHHRLRSPIYSVKGKNTPEPKPIPTHRPSSFPTPPLLRRTHARTYAHARTHAHTHTRTHTTTTPPHTHTHTHTHTQRYVYISTIYKWKIKHDESVDLHEKQRGASSKHWKH